MHFRLSLAALCAALCLCGSCTRPAEPVYLGITDAAAVQLPSLTFGSEGGVCSVRIQATGSWYLSAPEWLKTDPRAGTGVTDVTLTASRGTETARVGELKVRQGDDIALLEVRQDAVVPPPVQDPVLELLDGENRPLEGLSFGPEGGHVLIRVRSNAAWAVSASDDWLGASTSGSEGSTEVQIDCSVNPSENARKGTVTFRTGSITRELSLTQEGQPVITPVPAPKADLLDVVFNADGTAKDVSASALKVVRVPSSTMSVYYHSDYKRYVARFTQPAGQTVDEGFYYADYEANAAVKSGLEKSHSLELLMNCAEIPASGSTTVKPFSLMQSGGTGFLFSSSTHLNAQRRFAFLPYVGGGYQYVIADGVGIGRWHHVVGVWNHQEGKSYIYVDGRLSGTADTPGEYTHAAATACHFVVGGDPGKGLTTAQASFHGDIAVARAYSMPLSAGEVLNLYQSLGQ